MALPDTHDTERELLAKAAANVGATPTPSDDVRALLAKILTALAS